MSGFSGTFTDLVNKVYTETNRPDLVSETQQAILEATQSLHTIDYWYKDIVEALVVFDQPLNYIQSLDTGTLPNYRDIAYIRKTSPLVNSPEQFNSILPNSLYIPPNQLDMLQRVDIGDVFDMYGYEKTNIWYEAGSNIQIKSNTALQYALVGYYAFPDLDISGTGSNFNSWIAKQFPYAIVYRAAGTIFSKIGETQSWAIYMKPPMPQQGKNSGGLYYQQLAVIEQTNIRPGS